MADTYKSVAKGNAQVGQQIGRVHGDVSYQQHSGPTASEAPTIADLLASVRAGLIEAQDKKSIDEESVSAALDELAIAEQCLPVEDEQQKNRFVVAMKRAKGLVEGLSALTVKIAEAIAAVRGLQ